jgi:MATE family multidrug resistance protein
MGAAGEVYDNALLYVRIRLFGAPALLIKIALFGALRGLQDMRTPLYVALVVNGLNILLDAVLIYGWGFIPPLGVAGAAIATVISQCLGLVWAMWAIIRRLGWHKHPQFREIGAFLQIGRDMFLRTGLLTLFLLLATRVANQAGVDAGAAHQVLRQTWTFAAILLDGLAIAAQSLIGFFLGAAMLKQARKVAFVVCIWSVGVGLFLTFAMLLSQDIVLRLFVPASAIGVFLPAWYLIAFNQPLNSLAFASDGIHWGTGDFRYLRNAIALATSVGLLGLLLIDPRHPNALTMIWAVTIVWIIIRGIFGILRVWPGIGRSPLNPKDPA